MESLKEISVLARTLAVSFPESARRYHQARESINMVHESLHPLPCDQAILKVGRADLRTFSRHCLAYHKSLDDLVRLCDAALPEVLQDLELVDSPGFNFGQSDFDWPQFVVELRTIDKASRAAAARVSKSASEPAEPSRPQSEFAELLSWSRQNLKGNELRFVEFACDSSPDGMAYGDLLLEFDWDAENNADQTTKRVNAKLKGRAKLYRENNRLKIKLLKV